MSSFPLISPLFLKRRDILRPEFRINLDEVTKKVQELGGRIIILRCYINQYAPTKLIEAISNQGYEVRVISGDVDVLIAVDAIDLLHNDKIGKICIVTRDSDFTPILTKIREHGKETIIIAVEECLSASLKNVADYTLIIGEQKSNVALVGKRSEGKKN